MTDKPRDLSIAAGKLPASPASQLPTNAIAVVGMACRYPGANTPGEFWRNIVGGVESIRFFSREELLAAGVSAEQLARPNYVPAAGVLDDVAGFDAALFGISAREATVLDPQHRVFLECAWAALEDASIDPSRCEARIGVFAGAQLSSYAQLQHDALSGGDSGAYMEALVGNDKDYLSTRVSYRLDLRGPSVTLGSACSTSLSAVALACQSLQAEACDAALAGGVGINVPQERGYQYGAGGDALSTDGHCRAFDAAASGTAPGYGAGVVVLKRLEDALLERDPIYAVIRGYALNNDGRDKVGYWAPSVSGHAEVVTEALEFAGVNARDIGYLEAHGTGTPMGDPIEVAGLSAAFRADTPDRGYCAIGSVKTNIGHTSQAAGVAGLIKTVLALQHAQLPPSLNFERPNPKLQLERSPFYVNTEARAWPGMRRAGVSSLGLGGTNVHVVLEQAPPQALDATTAPEAPQLLPLSANSESALEASAERLIDFLAAHPDLGLASVASALARGRQQLPVRGYVVARDTERAAQLLLRRGRTRWLRHAPPRPREVVFAFPGASAVDLPALHRLARDFPVLRDALGAGLEQARALGLDLRCLLSADAPSLAADGGKAGEDLPRGLCALLLVEVALARFLIQCGVQPVAVLGHSSGEYAAACVSGALSLPAALQLQAGRARLLAGLPRRGAMLSVNLPEAEIVRRLGHQVPVSAYNADDVTLLSGDADQLADWARRLSGDDVVCRPSGVLGAAHSGFVEPIVSSLRELARGVSMSAPKLSWISTVTGQPMPATALTAEYWVRHTRDSVRFVQAVARAAQDPSRLVLEVGPGGHLTSLVQRILRTRGLENTALSSMPGPNTDATEYLLGQAGRMWALGVPLDLVELGQTRGVQPARLPTYPFEHVRYWIDSAEGAQPRAASAQPVTAGELASGDDAPYLYRPVWVRSPLPEAAPAAETRPWVLIGDGCPLCGALSELAEVEARPFVRAGGVRAFDPTSADSMQSLFETLRGSCPDGAVLLRCHAARTRVEGGDAPRAMTAGSDVLLEAPALARGLRAAGYMAPLTWVLISGEAQRVLGSERIDADVRALAVAERVLPRELPQVEARWLDVDAWAVRAAAAETARDIADELRVQAKHASVAFRNGQRWQRELRALDAQEDTARAGLLREGGRYLITGGLGRMGLSLAQYLGQLRGARVALIHTRELPPRERWSELASDTAEVGSTGQILSTLLALQSDAALGDRLELARADVADEPALQALCERLRAKWGAIDGAFHLAAKLTDEAVCTLAEPGAYMPDKNRGPKVHGAQVLAQIVERHGLEFCCLASSLSSEFGGLGNYGYAASNRALDALAERLDQPRGARWVSIAFDFYRPQAAEEGRPDPRAQLQALIGEHALRGRDLWTVLERALDARGEPQVIACGAPIERHIERFHNSLRRRAHAARPDLPSLYRAPEGSLQTKLAELWEELLHVAPIGVQDDFFQLGGDSLTVVRMIGICRERLGIELSAQALIQTRTIEQVAELIARKEKPLEPLVLRGGGREASLTGAPEHILICVTYAGGTALAFQPLADALPDGVAVWVLPPVREVDDVEALFARVIDRCRQASAPFSVYGHCGGSFQAVELARQLAAAGRAPVRVFAAATLPPEEGTTLPEELLTRVLEAGDVLRFFDTLGGLPGAASEDDARMAALAMRDDAVRLTELFRQFHAATAREKVPVPLSCLFGASDPLTAGWPERAKDWQRFFDSVSWQELPDAGHYFVQTDPARLAAILQRELGLSCPLRTNTRGE